MLFCTLTRPQQDKDFFLSCLIRINMARTRFGAQEEISFLAWGIVSNLPPYKLCWLINRVMEWDLKRVEDISIRHEIQQHSSSDLWAQDEREDQFFARYCHHDEGWLYKVDILSNRSDSDILFPSLRNIDYLLIGHGEIRHFPKDVKDVLLKLDGIQSVLTLNPKLVKDFERLHPYLE